VSILHYVLYSYQVRFCLLQAAHYGTPQTRVRFFLFAALRGYPLLAAPQPTHDFPQTHKLEIRFPNGDIARAVWAEAGTAPFKFVSIDDAISDLPRFDWCESLLSLSCLDLAPEDDVSREIMQEEPELEPSFCRETNRGAPTRGANTRAGVRPGEAVRWLWGDGAVQTCTAHDIPGLVPQSGHGGPATLHADAEASDSGTVGVSLD
jgi:site-specific DNA-cytosine methylase